MNLAPYKKTVVALVGAVITWALVALAEDPVTRQEWLSLLAAAGTALGVYGVANIPEDDAGQSSATILLVFVAGFLIGALCYANGIFVG